MNVVSLIARILSAVLFTIAYLIIFGVCCAAMVWDNVRRLFGRK